MSITNVLPRIKVLELAPQLSSFDRLTKTVPKSGWENGNSLSRLRLSWKVTESRDFCPKESCASRFCYWNKKRHIEARKKEPSLELFSKIFNYSFTSWESPGDTGTMLGNASPETMDSRDWGLFMSFYTLTGLPSMIVLCWRGDSAWIVLWTISCLNCLRTMAFAHRSTTHVRSSHHVTLSTFQVILKKRNRLPCSHWVLSHGEWFKCHDVGSEISRILFQAK